MFGLSESELIKYLFIGMVLLGAAHIALSVVQWQLGLRPKQVKLFCRLMR